MCAGRFGVFFIARNYEEIVVPSLWEQQTFIDKAGPEIIGQMYAFEDRGERPVCLIPEVTALVQRQWNETWRGAKRRPWKVFYVQRCYRYERPQAGRYREFTQAGVEILGGDASQTAIAVKDLRDCLDTFGVPYDFDQRVKRGLSYYVEDGFEASAPSLGAQKQIAGGGRYPEGVGWAIGVDRLCLAIEREETATGK